MKCLNLLFTGNWKTEQWPPPSSIAPVTMNNVQAKLPMVVSEPFLMVLDLMSEIKPCLCPAAVQTARAHSLTSRQCS